MQVSQALQQRLGPGLLVQVDNYPAPSIRQRTAQLITLTRNLILVFCFAGKNITDLLGIQLPFNFWSEFERKKWQWAMGAWFVGNSIANALISTGAFEVMYGNEVIHSKLATGRMPSIEEIVVGVEEAIARG
jgi:thioredoxin reductase-like selenoprotein T